VAGYEYRVERRARLLGEAMKQRATLFAEFLRPPGERPPFTQLLQEPIALKFWREHRYDDIGARVLANMKPVDIAELDSALTQHVEEQQMTPMGGQTNATAYPA
jgi:hypothetical protein